ncbi:MAG: sensor histidine kinase [Haloarculaceae archaeon]
MVDGSDGSRTDRDDEVDRADAGDRGPRSRGDGGATGESPLHRRAARSLTPGPVRRSYALQFALAMAVVILVVAGVGAASYGQIRGIIEDDAENTLRSTATLQADSVGDWVAALRSQARGFASSDVYGTGEATQIQAHLVDSLAVAGSDVVGLHYVDPETGAVLASTRPAYRDGESTVRSHGWSGAVAEATGGTADNRTVGMSDSAYERNGRLLVAFATRVRTGDGVLVLVGDARGDFRQLHRTRDIVSTHLLNPSGRDVFAPRRDRPSPLADTAEFDRALAGETVVLERSSDVVAFAPVPGNEWVVATEAPRSELYRASRTIGQNVVLLVAASLVALGLVGVVLGRRTVVPLVRLRERARAMEEGDLDVDLSSRREDEIGRLFDAFANMRDALRDQISEANEAREAAERSRRELARQNDRLDQFASTLSHDLRNPLNVASGHRELLERDLGDLDDPDDLAGVREHVDVIADSHERMESIIEDVLAMAREGEEVTDPEPVDLASAARDAWSTVESEDATLSVADTRTVPADYDRLVRAFENLFRNAVEHAGPAVAVEVGTTPDGFYVADDGPGIPANAVEDLFEYGYTSEDGGTGFGLAIVDSIARAHGWTVHVDREYDDGARFVVSGVGDDGDDPAA